jgi:periplasmic protein TonB
MNQEKILQSNLLDIIFENRNKAYGAYDLRVAYSKRMNAALFSTIAFCTCFVFC